MAAKKKGKALITRINVSDSKAHSEVGALVELLCRDREARDNVTAVLGSKKGKRSLKATIMGLTKTPKLTQRRGRIQPQIPKDLLERFKSLASNEGGVSCSMLVRTQLKRVFDLHAGEMLPRKGKQGGDMTGKFARQSELISRAKDLAKQGGRVPFQLDVETSKGKKLVKKYIKQHELTVGGLFSAIIERICSELEDKASKGATSAASIVISGDDQLQRH